MTSKIKAILFASIIVAMIAPISAMGISPQPIDVQADVNELTFHGNQYFAMQKDLAETKQALNKIRTNGTASEISEKENKISGLNESIEAKALFLEKMDQKRIERYAIEPVLNGILRSAQAQAKTLDLPIISTSVSGSQKALVIGIDETELTPTKDQKYYEDILKAEFGDLPLVVKFGITEDQSCTSAKANCNPLVGGIEIEAKNHLPCTLSLPAVRGTTQGFITAGHCVDNTSGSGDDVYQPTEDFFGFNKIGDVLVDLYQANCDCAFIDQSSGDSTQESVWRSSNNYLPITGYTDRASNGVGVVLFGQYDDTIQFGVIDDNTADMYVNGIHFDGMNLTTLISQGGDSGGAITNNSGNNYFGLLKGNNLNHSFVIPWVNIKAGLGL